MVALALSPHLGNLTQVSVWGDSVSESMKTLLGGGWKEARQRIRAEHL